MTAPTLEKSPHGAPCNRCGRCCADELCPLGRRVFGTWRGPCPALTFDVGGASSCDLVDRPRAYQPTRVAMHGAGKMSAAAAILIGSSVGCDAQFSEEPGDEEFRRRMIHQRQRQAFKIADAKRLWGVS